MTLVLKDTPDILCGVTELAASNTGTEVELADSNAVIFDVVGEIVVALGHGSHENRDALVLTEARDVVAHANNLGIETESDLAAVRWQMVGDGVLDHLDELLLGRSRADLVFVEQLHHQSGEALERSRYADCRADPDEHIL